MIFTYWSNHGRQKKVNQGIIIYEGPPYVVYLCHVNDITFLYIVINKN